MAVTVFRDAHILYGQYDLSGDHNEIRLDRKADMKEITRFGADTHTFISGLRGWEIAGRGYVNFDDSTTPKGVDNELFNEVGGLGAVGKVLTLQPTTNLGEVAYIGMSDADSYQFDLKNDSVGTFDLSLKATGSLTRGQSMVKLASRSATFTMANGIQLGALSATQKLAVSLHLTAFASATNVIATVYSKVDAVATGGTLRGTFSTLTGVGSQLLEITGPVTDTYWYITLTLTGAGTYSAAMAAGIR